MKKAIASVLALCMLCAVFVPFSSVSAAGTVSPYYFDDQNGVVTDIGPGVSVSDFKAADSAKTYTVQQSGKTVTSGIMSTGMTVTVDGKTYDVVICGDTDSNGYVTVSDVVNLRDLIMKSTFDDGAVTKACAITSYQQTGDFDTSSITVAQVVALRDMIISGDGLVYSGIRSSDSSEYYAPDNVLTDESGYNLWLNYSTITDPEERADLNTHVSQLVAEGTSDIITSATKELETAVSYFYGNTVTAGTSVTKDGAVVIGTRADSPIIASVFTDADLTTVGDEGYRIKSATYDGKRITAIAANSDKGVLYGTFKLLEKLQCGESLANIDYSDQPAIKWRVIDHWDNWSGSIERGYAGNSIFDWSALPDTVSDRYEDYARAEASVGINTVVINNVNTQFDYITSENLPKIKVIADIFRKYGIRLALTVRFDSPMNIDEANNPKTTTADPLDESVITWWTNKFNEIYSYVPDLAGILIKADSEGQPGPSQYGRTHADGANMFAKILAPHDSIVMWRTFVYGGAAGSISPDITMQQYGFFKPLDGTFDDNVIVQCKNGPQDFMPREPVSPIIGGMTETNIGVEMQITQEYTGKSTHLCYLVPQWKSYLDFDTQTTAENANTSEGTTVSKVLDGTVYGRSESLMAGVANIGDATNWTELELAQANWYGFGRLAWNPEESEETITDTWTKMTFGKDEDVVSTISELLEGSWETYESYTSPYGMGLTLNDDRDAPAPAQRNNGTYLDIDKTGTGHERTTAMASEKRDAVDQYYPAVRDLYNNIETCPEELLLWFHHVSYDYVLKSTGETLIQSLYDSYFDGPVKVQAMMDKFATLEGKIDNARYTRIMNSFSAQLSGAENWAEGMTEYYKEMSGIADEKGRVERVELSPLLTTANNILSSAVVGTEDGQYPQDAYNTFSAAISSAQSVYNDTASTTAQLTATISALTNAQDTFVNSVYGYKNAAYKKTATASPSGWVDTGYEANLGNDGDTTTRVSGNSENSYPFSWTVDLGSTFDLRNVKIYWFNNSNKRSYYYQIYAGLTTDSMTLVYDGSGNTTQDLTNDALPSGTIARYVTVKILGKSSTGGNASFYECEVYGKEVEGSVARALLQSSLTSATTLLDTAVVGTDPGQYPQEAYDAFSAAVSAASLSANDAALTDAQYTSAQTALDAAITTFSDSVVESDEIRNLALNRPVSTTTPDSVEAENPLSNGNDGSTSTRVNGVWDDSYPLDWTVDLGKVYTLSDIKILWYVNGERSYQYEIYAGDTLSAMTLVYDGTGNTTSGTTDDSLADVSARYVRVKIVGKSTATGRPSFYECEVYGK